MTTDQVLAATTADGTLSIIAGITTELVREVSRRHGMAPTASAAVGRLATGTALLGASLRPGERISLQVMSDGPLASLTADVRLIDEGIIGTRAYTAHPKIDLPLNAVGELDVRRAVGHGRLHVSKAFEHAQPFVGIVDLRSGEIDDDIAAYFVNSQQIPGVAALGVAADLEGIHCAGGIIAQVMPGVQEEYFEYLQNSVRRMPDISRLLREGADSADLIASLTQNALLRSEQSFELDFFCGCTKERVEAALLSLGPDELESIAGEQPLTEATCEFCRRVYELTSSEVLHLAQQLKGSGT